jgi:dTDP-4-dehydrorhamnose reductase
MKKIYIAGAGGMLGEAFFKQFHTEYQLKCTDIDVNSDWLSYLHFRDLNQYKNDVVSFEPDFLFHLGALTDLEYCELNEQSAYETNTQSVGNAIKICKELGIPLLYISTAGIFDGKQDVYDDWDAPNPLCVYAASKYAGEKLVQNELKKYLICRPGWMMGGGPSKDKKFIQKIMGQLKNGAPRIVYRR